MGLSNLGNTCFMNSTLQCLSNVPAFARYFSSRAWERDLNSKSPSKGEMATAYAELMEKMWKPASPNAGLAERPLRVKTAVGRIAPRFVGYDQHDAQEFLRFLLDALHDDVNRVTRKLPYEELKDPAEASDSTVGRDWWRYYTERNDSHVADCFAGQLRTELHCLVCQYRSRAFDPFLDLSVPIPRAAQIKEKASRSPASPSSSFFGGGDDGAGSSCDLYACLSSFAAPEKLEGDNMWYCPRCKKHQPSMKKTAIFRLPEVLVIHLKRFSFGTFRRSKLSTSVSFPLTGLDISSYLAEACEFIHSTHVYLLHRPRFSRFHPLTNNPSHAPPVPTLPPRRSNGPQLPLPFLEPV